MLSWVVLQYPKPLTHVVFEVAFVDHIVPIPAGRDTNRIQDCLFDSVYWSSKPGNWVHWAHLPAKYYTHLTVISEASSCPLLGTYIMQANRFTDSFQHYLSTQHLGLPVVLWEATQCLTSCQPDPSDIRLIQGGSRSDQAGRQICLHLSFPTPSATVSGLLNWREMEGKAGTLPYAHNRVLYRPGSIQIPTAPLWDTVMQTTVPRSIWHSTSQIKLWV